jgi:hypothetical protein
MNVQEKLAAIEQHAAKTLIEVRELQDYLASTGGVVVRFDDVPAHTPTRIVTFPGRSRATSTGYVSPADESVEWPEDAA